MIFVQVYDDSNSLEFHLLDVLPLMENYTTHNMDIRVCSCTSSLVC